MKILWVSPSMNGPIARILNRPPSGTSGGWIQTTYEALALGKGDEMFFLCTDKSVAIDEVLRGESEEGKAFCINQPSVPFGKAPSKKYLALVQKIIDEISPDIIHIWGTEMCIQYTVSLCSPNIPKVVFLQGMCGIHRRYRGGYLKSLGISSCEPPVERLMQYIKKRLFYHQAELEREELLNCKNVIIDSEFAKAFVNGISKDIALHTLYYNPNSVFYARNWDYDQCEKYSIFTVFGGSADKGLHQLLRAVAIVKNTVPQVKLYVPGGYCLDSHGNLDDKGKLSAYEKILHRLITELDLKNNVVFCGKLSQDEMAEKLSRVNVFVNPSIMEHHAGTLREAMAVGTPSVSTLSGSVGEFVIEGVTGTLYRYEEHEILAAQILKYFENKDFAIRCAENGKKCFCDRREDSKNYTLMVIYQKMLERGTCRE